MSMRCKVCGTPLEDGRRATCDSPACQCEYHVAGGEEPDADGLVGLDGADEARAELLDEEPDEDELISEDLTALWEIREVRHN